MLKFGIGAAHGTSTFSYASRLIQSSAPSRAIASGLCVSLLALACDAGETSDDSEGSAGSPPAGAGAPSFGGGPGAGGSTAGSPPVSNAGSSFGTPVQMGDGMSSNRYQKADVARDGQNYFFMANGWGPGFQSQTVSWRGTSFTVNSMQGTEGANWEPASYPTVFCGAYSDSISRECGLPKAITDITSLRTGWRWSPNGNSGEYNVAYDIWLSTSATIANHSSFLMVWLRDPPGQQPAGQRQHQGIAVPGVPGTWNIWVGVVGGKPCISYVRAEGQDTLQLEFDAMAFVNDVRMRSINMPGTTILSVAVGFEIWNGPITNLVSEDFYVKVN